MSIEPQPQPETDDNYQPFSQSQYEQPLDDDHNYNDGEQHPVTPEDCPKCDGSGGYGTGTQVSVCYGCKGKGWQDDADVRRNATYFHRNPSKR